MTALRSTIHRLLIMFPVGAALACNLPLNPSNPGNSGPVGPIIQVTATPPSTETPTPSPTPQPVITLQAGEIYLRNGDYDAATLAFQNVVVNPGAATDQLVSAHFGLAKASLKRGDFGPARASLDTVISDYRAYLSLKPGLIDSYV